MLLTFWPPVLVAAPPLPPPTPHPPSQTRQEWEENAGQTSCSRYLAQTLFPLHPPPCKYNFLYKSNSMCNSFNGSDKRCFGIPLFSPGHTLICEFAILCVVYLVSWSKLTDWQRYSLFEIWQCNLCSISYCTKLEYLVTGRLISKHWVFVALNPSHLKPHSAVDCYDCAAGSGAQQLHLPTVLLCWRIRTKTPGVLYIYTYYTNDIYILH